MTEMFSFLLFKLSTAIVQSYFYCTRLDLHMYINDEFPNTLSLNSPEPLRATPDFPAFWM